MTQMSGSGLSASQVFKVTLDCAKDEWIRGHWRVFLEILIQGLLYQEMLSLLLILSGSSQFFKAAEFYSPFTFLCVHT